MKLPGRVILDNVSVVRRHSITGIFIVSTKIGRLTNHVAYGPQAYDFTGSVLDGQNKLFDYDPNAKLASGDTAAKALDNATYFVGRSFERLVRGK